MQRLAFNYLIKAPPFIPAPRRHFSSASWEFVLTMYGGAWIGEQTGKVLEWTGNRFLKEEYKPPSRFLPVVGTTIGVVSGGVFAWNLADHPRK